MLRQFSVLFAILFLFTFAGCEDAQQLLEDLAKQAPATSINQGNQRQPMAPPPAVAGDKITIASFNIQVFGTSKAKKPEVMDVLAKVVRRFDIVAIQEIRSKDQTVVPQFVNLINAEGAAYDFVIGPRLGRTTSKEQYCFIYNTATIELAAQSVYTVDDPRDLLHREPMVARFGCRGVPPAEAFTFTLVNIHTDPDETDTELDALDDVFLSVQQNGMQEDDVILLGDLNVDERHLGELGRLSGIGWVVSGVPTNTRGNKTYDNIVFHRGATTEYTGNWGVLNLMTEFGLSEEEALKVSDHMPVWAEFRATEAGPGVPVAAHATSSSR